VLLPTTILCPSGAKLTTELAPVESVTVMPGAPGTKVWDPMTNVGEVEVRAATALVREPMKILEPSVWRDTGLPETTTEEAPAVTVCDPITTKGVVVVGEFVVVGAGSLLTTVVA